MNPSGETSPVSVVAVATVDELRERIRRKRQLKGRQPDAQSIDEVRSLIAILQTILDETRIDLI